MLKLLAVDAHGSLIALGDTHLVPAALDLLTRVLGGVYIWKRRRKIRCAVYGSLFPPTITTK